MEKNNIQIQIDETQSGQRLDKFLCGVEGIGSRSRAVTLIDDSKVLVNGKAAKSSYLIRVNDIVKIEIPSFTSTELVASDISLDIIYQDSDVLVINKPSGLVVHPAAGHEADTLVNAILFHVKDFNMKFGEVRPGIVHRLDKDTSGVMVVAKNDFTHEHLTRQFKERSIDRVYYAMSCENEIPSKGLIKSYLARHPSNRKKYASVRDVRNKIIREPIEDFEKGKWSVTEFEKLAIHGSGISLVKLKLHTGRTHQIRVHLSEMGANIMGDEIYGNPKTKRRPEDFPHLALHAAELGFTHPVSGKRLFFRVPWPKEMHETLIKLGFSNISYEAIY